MDSIRPFALLSLLLLLAVSAAAGTAPHAVITVDGGEMLIPVAGHAVGAGGELFRTDLTIVNLTSSQQTMELLWLPSGGTDSPNSWRVLVGPFAFLPMPNVVGGMFQASGVGAIYIRPVVPAAGQAFDAHARIWTDSTCAGLRGTVSQSVPAMLLDGWRNESPAYVHGVTQDGQFRANYGIVNVGSERRRFTVMVNSAHGKATETIDVPPFGVVQKPVPPGPSGELSVYIEPVAPAGPWRAYAASTDNRSGSGWTVLAMQPRVDVQY